MNLYADEKETLLCYMAGMGYIEIYKYFAVTNITIWYKRKKFNESTMY